MRGNGLTPESVWHLGVVGVDPSEQGKGSHHISYSYNSLTQPKQATSLASLRKRFRMPQARRLPWKRTASMLPTDTSIWDLRSDYSDMW